MSEFRPSVVFLDRDGVLIENVHTYVREWDEVQVFDQAVEAVRVLFSQGIPVVVVTNQAGVGRGVMSYDHVKALNARILAEIESRAGGRFTACYICPHHPDDDCDCRKPRPGMLLQAAREHDLDLSRGVMVGDGVTDVQCAIAAGVHPVLVRTGRGTAQEAKLGEAERGTQVVEDLLRFVSELLVA